MKYMAMVTERDVWKTVFKSGWEISEFKDVHDSSDKDTCWALEKNLFTKYSPLPKGRLSMKDWKLNPFNVHLISKNPYQETVK